MFMVYWILIIVSASLLGYIFWKRYVLTKRSLVFEKELRKEEQRLSEEETTPERSSDEEPIHDIQLKRYAEQRAREEKNRCLREAKKAYKQGDLHFSKGDYDLAEKHLIQVLSFDNDHLDANFKLGLLYLHQENLPRAEFFFQKLIDIKEHPVYYSNLALTLYQQNRLPEATQLYEKAIELDDKHAGRFVNLAHIYQELGESEKALRAFEEASRLDPRNLDYLWTLIQYYEKFSQIEEVRRVLKRILELDPYNAQAREKWSN